MPAMLVIPSWLLLETRGVYVLMRRSNWSFFLYLEAVIWNVSNASSGDSFVIYEAVVNVGKFDVALEEIQNKISCIIYTK